MSIDAEVERRAADSATAFAGSAESLRLSIHKMRDELRALEDKLRLAESAIERGRRFKARRDDSVQCPHCWVERGVHAALYAIGDGSPTVDRYRCSDCGREVEHEFRR
jgi:DNA-directed RNA polymerase subunit RPC12/RpoP